jgi:hypothetical protein
MAQSYIVLSMLVCYIEHWLCQRMSIGKLEQRMREEWWWIFVLLWIEFAFHVYVMYVWSQRDE